MHQFRLQESSWWQWNPWQMLPTVTDMPLAMINTRAASVPPCHLVPELQYELSRAKWSSLLPSLFLNNLYRCYRDCITVKKNTQIILFCLGNEKGEPVFIFKSIQHLKCGHAISLWVHHCLGRVIYSLTLHLLTLACTVTSCSIRKPFCNSFLLHWIIWRS